MVYRIYVEKKKEFANEAASVLNEANTFLGIKSLSDVRVINRYDTENISRELFDDAVKNVFSEPQIDDTYDKLELSDCVVFAVEFLPGQFDQRADSAAQCIQLISAGERPIVKSAKIYALYGELSEADTDAIKKYLINPVEAREASLEEYETLKTEYETPDEVQYINGFIGMEEEELKGFIKENGLAMDLADITFCRDYFRKENRDPSITEIKMIDTYWSDHCRHTTFMTEIDGVEFEDELIQKAYDDYISLRKDLNRTKPVCLMDIATVAVRALKAEGKLDKLDESEEINACTVNIDVEIDGKKEPWLLLFKNETHNHPTEIEPFGGAATCVGGAIRDPLSGRSYVYGAMRVTGAADPTTPVSETLPGKLPQRKIVTTAAAGYSSYGNQIGLATGIVDEIYHPGYAAKRMEIGAVIAATPKENVRRERPAEGDAIILLGGGTGRDGIGGATGSSKAHDSHSVETCGAEVQKGNAPEERKLQRLFRNPEACRMIKKCNDFGAGGVSVAIGELAGGLLIDLDKVPKKYEGLDGTELAISESQERMAVVIKASDVDSFLKLSKEENLNAVKVADVTKEQRLVMTWNGKKIVDISREFLDSNGAPKHINIKVGRSEDFGKPSTDDFEKAYKELAGDLNICSKRGLSERFDSTIGAGTVLMPFGGKNQLTPIQAMAHKLPVLEGTTDDCSLMAFGYNPYIFEKSRFHGAYLAVVESVSRLIASGADFNDVYLSFQEYFEKPGQDPERWGKPFAALLGAFKAQMDLSVGAIGGKDSMSGSYEDLDVPPTLVSFAVTVDKTENIISPEFKQSGNKVYLLKPAYNEDGLPNKDDLLNNFARINELVRAKKAVSCYTPGMGGVAEAVMKMCMGNGFGFEYEADIDINEIFGYNYGAFVVEATEDIPDAVLLGRVTEEKALSYSGKKVLLDELSDIYENRLEEIFNCNIKTKEEKPEDIQSIGSDAKAAAIKCAKPKVLIPVFPGTNCEYDSARAVEAAGAEAEIMVIRNLSAKDISESIDVFADKLENAQMIFVPGGFSGGDEPDGSGKFITAFFRNEKLKDGIHRLLDEKDGLICGICNGFQALIKLGLVPYGRITDTDEAAPTLTFNTIGRHQSKIVRTKIVSNRSPWLSLMNVGDIVNVPISHGEGRFYASEDVIRGLIENGQVATQYVDMEGRPTFDIQYNPNGSSYAIEGITSPCGRVFGKMGHSERVGSGLYKNVPGNYDIRMFEAAVKYFK